MRRCALLAAVIGLAGCYSPSIDACALACAANNACPDGLACNAQGLCAATATDTCVPGDGAVDAPVNPRLMTVEVLDPRGDPQPGVDVVFSDADGATVVQVMTDAQGLAQTEMEPGGMATVARVATSPQVAHTAVTYVDLPPGAHIYVQPDSDVRPPRAVHVAWTPPAQMHEFQVLTSCGSTNTVYPSTETETTITVPAFCTEVDVVVTARSAQTEPPMVAIARAQTSPDVHVGGWEPVDALAVSVSNLLEAQAIRPRVTWRMSPSSGGVGGVAQGGYDGATRTISGLVTRDDVRAAVQLDIVSTAVGSVGATQSFAELVPPGAVSHNVDLDGKLVEHVDAPQYLANLRRAQWTPVKPGLSPGDPDAVQVTLSLMRGPNTSIAWRVIGPTSAIRTDTTAGTRFVELPPLPSAFPFVPQTGDSLVAGSITLYGVPDIARRALIARLGVANRSTPLPALDYLSASSRSFPTP